MQAKYKTLCYNLWEIPKADSLAIIAFSTALLHEGKRKWKGLLESTSGNPNLQVEKGSLLYLWFTWKLETLIGVGVGRYRN